MKVLFHIPFPAIGGAETQIQYLLKYLNPEIKVSVTYEYPEVEAFVKALRVPHYRVHSPLSLTKVIEDIRPDIIHFYHSHTMFNALKRLSTVRPKTYEVVHNRLPFGGDCTDYPKSFTDMVVCVSPDAQSYFSSKMPEVRSVVIPNGVDTEVFKPVSRIAKSGRLVGGFAGRLEAGWGKGIPTLIEVMSKLPADFELIGTDYGGFAQFVRENSYDNIKVLPYTPNPVDAYKRWDFFVSASPAEGFGLSIAEALATGLPAALIDCGGVCHYIEDGKHALLAKGPAELSGAIKKIIDGNPSLRPAELDLSAQKMARAYEQLYLQLVQQPALTRVVASAPKVIPAAPPKAPQVEATIQSLAVVEDSWHGVRRALTPLADRCCSPRDALSVIRHHRPKLVVFGCYMPSWERILLEAKRQGAKTALTWHASYILNEFDHINREWMYHALKAAKEGLFDFVATPHEGLAYTWSNYGVRTDFLPNVIEAPLTPPTKLKGFNFGILGSGQPWKNMDCQIVAAGMFKGNAKIHVQNLKHSQAVDILGIPVVRHPHLRNDNDYYKLVGGMTLNLCVSLSEVYSYFMAESLLLGTPVVTGAITPILKDAPGVLQACRTPYFEDPFDIFRSIDRVLSNYDEIRKVGTEYMQQLNDENKERVKAVVQRWKNIAGL